MARNLVLLPSGALGLSSGGALSVADDAGGCTPCCGGGGGGPGVCCIQVDPDGSQCGIADASPCASVSGFATLETAARLDVAMIPDLGGQTLALVNIPAVVLRSDLRRIACNVPGCSFQTEWTAEQAESGIVSIPNGAGGQDFRVTTRPGFGVTGAINVIRDDARIDAPSPRLAYQQGNTVVRRGVIFEPMSGGGTEARPTSGFGGAPDLPSLYAIIASNIIRTGTVPRPRQDFAASDLIVTGWDGPGALITERTVTGSYTAVRSGCELALTLDVQATFAATRTIPSQSWVYFQRVDGRITHRLHFELVVGLTACDPTPGIRGGGRLVADLLGMMGA